MILLVAKSGSGKDYLVKTLGLRQVVSHTTRAPRPGEIDGVDKHFHSANTPVPVNALVSTRFSGNNYWVVESDLADRDVFIIDVNGVRNFMRHYGVHFKTKCTVVYLKCPWYRRLYRMLKRGDSFRAAVQRLIHDAKAFSGIAGIPHKELCT